MDIVTRLRRPGIADYELDCGVANAAAHEIEQLRKSLARCLEEAEEWLDDARGCKPADVMDYDGWADEARRLLGHNVEVQRDSGSIIAGGSAGMVGSASRDSEKG